MTHVCHLLDGNGGLMGWEAFKGLHGRGSHRTVPCDEREYTALMASLPEIWREKLMTSAAARQRSGSLSDAIRGDALR